MDFALERQSDFFREQGESLPSLLEAPLPFKLSALAPPLASCAGATIMMARE